ncbi:MAG: hypothetical protein K2X39_02175, partial [Silvanigrellaceae bacterium]|nr:hypothetical protein [Silvanigrellaceae bacterium]
MKHLCSIKFLFIFFLYSHASLCHASSPHLETNQGFFHSTVTPPEVDYKKISQISLEDLSTDSARHDYPFHNADEMTFGKIFSLPNLTEKVSLAFIILLSKILEITVLNNIQMPEEINSFYQAIVKSFVNRGAFSTLKGDSINSAFHNGLSRLISIIFTEFIYKPRKDLLQQKNNLLSSLIFMSVIHYISTVILSHTQDYIFDEIKLVGKK